MATNLSFPFFLVVKSPMDSFEMEHASDLIPVFFIDLMILHGWIVIVDWNEFTEH